MPFINQIEVNSVVYDLRDSSVDSKITDVMKSIAPPYDDLEFPVFAKQLCWHTDNDVVKLYRAKQDLTSENWTSSHWKETVVEDELGTLKNTMNDLADALHYVAPVNFSTASSKKGFISPSTNKWTQNNSALSYFIPVTAGNLRVTVTANSSLPSRIAFLQSNTVTHGSVAPFCSGTSNISVPSGQTREYDIPDDCGYICVTEAYSSDSGYTPASMGIYKAIDSLAPLNDYALAGAHTIMASEMESGTWNYDRKADNSKRLRNQQLYPIKKGMLVQYDNPTLQLDLIVVQNYPTASWNQSSGWISAGSSGTFTTNLDGYLIVLVQSENDITTANYDCTIKIFSVERSKIESISTDTNTLKSKFEQQETIDLTNTEIKNYCVSWRTASSQYVWHNGNDAARSYFIPVITNATQIAVTANSSQPAYINFLPSMPTITPLNPVTFCAGTTQNMIDAGTTRTFNIPVDCTVINITKFIYATPNYTPSSVVFILPVEIPIVDTTLTQVGKAADAKTVGDALFPLKEYATTGTFAITSDMIEQGSWAYSSKPETLNTKRLRSKELIPIRAGMTIQYTNPTLQITFGVLETKTSSSYIEVPGWRDSGAVNAEYTFQHDGYVALILQSENDITVSDYDCTVKFMSIPGHAASTISSYFPHEVTLLTKSDLATDKYVNQDATVGSNWTSNLTSNTGSLYTTEALDVSAYMGKTLVIEIGSNDAHSGVRTLGFCNTNDIISYTIKETSLGYTSEDGYLRAKLTISNTNFYFSCSNKSHLRIYVKTQGTLLDKIETDTMYVATDGSDSNTGTSVTPLATINKALDLGASRIMIKAGTYSQTVNLSKAKKSNVSIVNASPTGKVTFNAPNCLIADTETAVSGYTKVYSVATTKTFNANNIWIFQSGIPDAATEITAAKRKPEQRGQQYRCMDTRIIKSTATSLEAALTDIENSAAYKWYLDDGTLYFSRPEIVSATNPICGSFGTTFFSNGSRRITINMAGIDIRYMSLNLNNTCNSHIVDCSVANIFGAGAFLMDGAVEAELIRCEASRTYTDTNGDGFNAHSAFTGYAFSHQTTVLLVDCWSHDNNDDGVSLHERSEFTVIGGLYERNYYGGGITPASGSHCVCIGVCARENGEGGFLYMGDTASAEGGVGGQMRCVNCISESNNIWTAVASAGYKVNGDGNKAILIDCKAINEDNGYFVKNTTSTMELTDCGAYNCTNVKGGQTSVITVTNTTLVT